MDCNYIDSMGDIQTRPLIFIKDSNGTIHLQYNALSLMYLSKFHPNFKVEKKLIHYRDKDTIEVIDCTNLNLKGNEAFESIK